MTYHERTAFMAPLGGVICGLLIAALGTAGMPFVAAAVIGVAVGVTVAVQGDVWWETARRRWRARREQILRDREERR